MSESMHSLGKCLLTDLNTTVFTIRSHILWATRNNLGLRYFQTGFTNYIHITLTVKAEKQTCFLGGLEKVKTQYKPLNIHFSD